MERKPLTEFLDSLLERPAAWAKTHGLHVSSLYRHKNWEAGLKGPKARPMGQTQCKDVIRATGGKLTMDDLRPDIAMEIRQIQELESNHAPDLEAQNT